MDETESVEQYTPPAPEPFAPASEASALATPAPEAPVNGAPASQTASSDVPATEAPAPVTHDPAALATLAERASIQRLPIFEEQRAAQLVSAALIAGADDLVPLLSKLGWAASSRGVVAAWPELKATARTAFLKALATDETESGRRIRLSVARGLFKVPDLPACGKLVAGVCKEIRDKKTGEVLQKDAQNFAAVMIGKGKPWVAQLTLADFKPADATALVQCALVAAFSVNGPPVTPLGVLKWAGEAGQLAELPEPVLAAITKGVSRWSPKWAEALRKEVTNAPEAILAALKTPQPEPERKPAPPTDESADATRDGATDDDEDDEDDEDGLPLELKDEGAAEGEAPKQRPVYVSKTVPPKDQRQPQQPPQQREPRDQREGREPREPREGREPRDQRGPAPKSLQFNASEALRQIESHVSWLKNELQFTEKKLRAREDDRRQSKRQPEAPVIAGEPTPEELARLNVQLEARITELQSRIDDLTADAETRATSSGGFSGEQPAPDAQLRTLLGLKLAEHYADFAALEQEDRDIVIPQHYRTVLTEVFAVLKAEGIPLEQPPQA